MDDIKAAGGEAFAVIADMANVDDIKKIKGDITVLGAGGKMGPTLCVLAKNAVKIYLPGEMEWDNKAKNEASGYLEITDAMAAGYMKLSKMTGVNINIEE